MSSRFAQSLTYLADNIDRRFDVKTRWEAAREFVQNQPLRALFFGTVVATVIIPVMVFMFVVGSSLAVGLATLLCIQGAILTAATVVLIPVVAFCVMCASAFTVLALVSGYAFRAAEWAWSLFYGAVGAPVNDFVARGASSMSNFNIRSKIALPSVNCKVTGKSSNNSNDNTQSQGHGDYPRFHARMTYTAPDMPDAVQQLQNED